MTEGCRDGQNLRNVRPLANEKPAGRKRQEAGAAGAGELRGGWDLLDVFASSFVMWTAFASRSLRRAGETRLAGPEVKESNSALEATE